MPSHLRTTTSVPPGQFFIKVIYDNGREDVFYGPCKTTPNCRIFGPSPLIEEPAKSLSAFRRANNIPRSGLAECIEDISLYTCARIGGMSTWCFDSEKSFNQISPVPIAPAPCSGCGHKLT